MSDWTIKIRRGTGEPNPAHFSPYEIALDLERFQNNEVGKNQIWFRNGDLENPTMEPLRIGSENIYDKGMIGGVPGLQEDTRLIKDVHMPITTSTSAPTQTDADDVKEGHLWLQYET